MVPDDKINIFLAVPNLGNIVVPLVENILFWTHDKRYRITTYMPSNIFPLDAARNKCVRKFLESGCEYLWWIDADIVPPVTALQRLIEADKDIIGATCFSVRRDQGDTYPYPVTLRYDKNKEYKIYYGKGVEEVDATGGACVLVKRKVYEMIERPYQFHYNDDGTLALTCDFDVWKKAQASGFKIYVDFSIACSHIRTTDIKGLQDLLAKVSNGESARTNI